MIFDIHSHIIPCVDDGSKSIGESMQMLESMKSQGVDKVIATPHFYVDNVDFDEYIEDVNSQFSILTESVKTKALPEIFLGYEVYYFKGIASCNFLEKLTINNSKYILIELPYSAISQRVIDEIVDVSINRKLVPIIAHIDRYFEFDSIKKLVSIFDDGLFLGQVNTTSLMSLLTRKKALTFFNEECCQFIGSDAHNMASRKPNIKKALDFLNKNGYKEVLEKHAESLYNNIK